MIIGKKEIDGTDLIIDSKEYLTKKVQIVAKTDSGKTYAASKICEEMLKENQPITIIDPVSAYWALKQKWQVIIFGDKRNKHADYPLYDDKKTIDAQAELIADFLAVNPASAIIDLKYWVENKQQQFMAAFASRLYAKVQIPRHIFIEEADVFAPQTITYPDETHSRHHTDVLVRRGRQEGLGCTVITQRPALVSKNILTQSDLSIYLNLSGAPDLYPARKEINDDDDLSKDEKQKIIGRIKRLERGTAFFYSPRWLNLKEFVRVSRKETYHAGATRGSPDWKPDTDVSLITIDIDDVKEKLLEIASLQAPEQLTKMPELSDSKKFERMLEAEKQEIAKQLSAGFDEKTKKLEEFWQEKLKESIDKLKEYEQLGALLKKLVVESHETLPIDEKITTSAGDSLQQFMQTASEVNVNVTESVEEEKTIEGKIRILIRDGIYNEPASPFKIHKLILQEWPGSIDGTYSRIRPEIVKALKILAGRPYKLVTLQSNELWRLNKKLEKAK